MDTAVEMKGITVVFPGTVANEDVDFDVRRGEVHALLGENGAGKTTLMNVLYGLCLPLKGEIRIRGREANICSPRDAISLGIGMVHQHFMLIPPFTVAENVVLGNEPVRAGIFTDKASARARVESLSKRFGLAVQPDARVSDISVGQQQRVEILKVLYRGAEILILDEPTAVLTPQEVDELGTIMRNLTRSGKAVIFITHKLREVMAFSDRVTIMRKGRKVATLPTQETTAEELGKLMVGSDFELTLHREPNKPGPVILEVENLKVNRSDGLPLIKGVSFQVRAGEILGIAGIEGNGQSELVEAIAGLRRSVSGAIKIGGCDVAGLRPADVASHGLSFIPEDRHKRGLVLDFSVEENLVLGKHRRRPFARKGRMNLRQISTHADRLISEYGIKTAGARAPARTLSGGNQQKVVVARELSKDPKVIVAFQPTRGLDVGAARFVHSRLLDCRRAGKAVLLVSLELEEILALSDRILVLYEGQIVGSFASGEADEQQIGYLMAGGQGAVRALGW